MSAEEEKKQFKFLYLRFWHMGISFLTSLNNPLFKNIPHGGSFWHFVICCICVFVCLCICVFVFGLGRSLLDQFGQKNASPLSSTFWFESSKPSYLFKFVLLLQPYSIWVGGLAPVVRGKKYVEAEPGIFWHCLGGTEDFLKSCSEKRVKCVKN